MLPRLAEGLEFGPEETAGGTVIAFLPPDRYLEVSSQTARVLRLVDGERDVRTLAELASAELAAEISPVAFQTLLDQRLIPRGLVRYDDSVPVSAPSRSRRGVRFLPAGLVGAIARALAFLYRLPVAVLAVAACAGTQVWFFLAGPRAGAPSSDLGGWLVVILLYMASMLAHEIGHATALQSFGARPGAIGIDATLGLPRWGAGVSGIWRLRRRQRVVVDLGGIYFQSFFVGTLILLHVMSPGLIPASVIARTVALVDMVILFCLVPRWRADGFWLAADLAGTRYPRADAPAADRGSAHAIDVAPPAYAAWYSLLAAAGFAGLWVWLTRHPEFGAGRVVLEALALGGLALAVGIGLAWIAAVARAPGRGRSQARHGGGA